MSATDALQATLGVQHEAVWTYAALAARTSATTEGSLFALLQGGYVRHRVARDHLALALTDLGAQPVAALPGYARPATASARERAEAAVAVEQACADAYAWQVSHTSGEHRTWAVAALTWSATQSAGLGAAPTPWPGAAELGEA